VTTLGSKGPRRTQETKKGGKKIKYNQRASWGDTVENERVEGKEEVECYPFPKAAERIRRKKKTRSQNECTVHPFLYVEEGGVAGGD